MSVLTIVVLSALAVGVLCAAMYLCGYIRLPAWKRIAVVLFGALFALSGLFLMFRIESGYFRSISYFGAHFMGPIGIAFGCVVFRVRGTSARDMMDVAAPMLSVTNMVSKINCLIHGCCRGRVLWTDERGFNVLFPSQIAECINALLITVYLIYCIRKGRHRGMIAPLFYAIYGVTRFYLNLLRDTEPFALGLPAGNLWSLLSIFVSIVWMYIRYLRVSNEKMARAHRSRAKKRLG